MFLVPTALSSFATHFVSFSKNIIIIVFPGWNFYSKRSIISKFFVVIYFSWIGSHFMRGTWPPVVPCENVSPLNFPPSKIYFSSVLPFECNMDKSFLFGKFLYYRLCPNCFVKAFFIRGFLRVDCCFTAQCPWLLLCFPWFWGKNKIPVGKKLLF